MQLPKVVIPHYAKNTAVILVYPSGLELHYYRQRTYDDAAKIHDWDGYSTDGLSYVNYSTQLVGIVTPEWKLALDHDRGSGCGNVVAKVEPNKAKRVSPELLLEALKEVLSEDTYTGYAMGAFDLE